MTTKEKNHKKIEQTAANLEEHTNVQKSQEEILVDQLCEGLEVYKEHEGKVFLSSYTAGLEIGFSYLLIAILYTILDGKFSSETLPYIVAFAYPVGFIIVVLGKSLLYTEQTSILALPVFHKKRSIGELLKLWGIVILGNLIGGACFALLIGWTGPAMGIISVDSTENIAVHVSHGTAPVIFGSAVFAGWLMALLSWLISSANETISRIFIIYMITAVVGFAGFHHSIVGNIEVLSGFLFTDAISLTDYISFLSIALLGNAFGGVFFVALLKYRSFKASF